MGQSKSGRKLLWRAADYRGLVIMDAVAALSDKFFADFSIQKETLFIMECRRDDCWPDQGAIHG